MASRFANGVKFNVQIPVAVAAVIADGLALASSPEASNKCSATTKQGESETERGRGRESYIELESHFISDLLIFCSYTSVAESPTCQLCQNGKHSTLKHSGKRCFAKRRFTLKQYSPKSSLAVEGI